MHIRNYHSPGELSFSVFSSSWMDTVARVARHSAWIDKNFWQIGNVRHESAAFFPEGILFLRIVLLRFSVSCSEFTAGRDMASYATSFWTISVRSRFRQHQGNATISQLYRFKQHPLLNKHLAHFWTGDRLNLSSDCWTRN